LNKSEHDFHFLLAHNSRSTRCLGYDACPGPYGLLYNIDGYSERWSRYDFLSYQDWGYRAVMASIADIIASGGKPLAIMYSVGVKSPDQALMVSKGVGDAATELGVSVLKSDFNKAKEGWIDVASIGYSKRPVSRNGASPGDLVVQVGYLGYGLLERLVMEKKIPLSEALRVKGIPRRKPPMIGELISKYATASCDNSDGWGATLMEIALYSGVRIEIDNLIIDPQVFELVMAKGEIVSWWESWEDYNIAITLARENLEPFINECRRLGIVCGKVGRVVGGTPTAIINGVEVGKGWSWINE